MSALQNLPTNFSYLSPVGFKFSLANFPEVTYFCQAANIPGNTLKPYKRYIRIFAPNGKYSQ